MQCPNCLHEDQRDLFGKLVNPTKIGTHAQVVALTREQTEEEREQGICPIPTIQDKIVYICPRCGILFTLV